MKVFIPVTLENQNDFRRVVAGKFSSAILRLKVNDF